MLRVQFHSPERGFAQYRWVICALLFFAATVNYIDRQILSLVKEMLDTELQWNNAQFGLVNSAFQGAYAIGLLGFGWFVDKFGSRIGEKAFPNRVSADMEQVIAGVKQELTEMSADAHRLRRLTAWPWIISLNLTVK